MGRVLHAAAAAAARSLAWRHVGLDCRQSNKRVTDNPPAAVILRCVKNMIGSVKQGKVRE